ncbi:MAG: Maf family protein [Candidatus Izemoplasma sp.]|nr:Maf family protein [Candidatus Izemoplasma sp.]
MNKKVILASQSPRRKQLLALFDFPFKIIPSTIEEAIDMNKADEEIAMALALQKALDVSKHHPNALVLGFDTIVVKDHHILNKPVDQDDAKRMLELLSGTNHQVITGCAIVKDQEYQTFYENTDVYFKSLTISEIEEYIATNEPFDKAGAYGIQGHGAKYIKKIVGDYYTVMGLPVHQLYMKLIESGDL